MSKKTEIRELQLELQSMYENADQMGDLVESYEVERDRLANQIAGMQGTSDAQEDIIALHESDRIEFNLDKTELRAIIAGYERAEQRRKADRLQAESDAKEARYLQQIEDGLVSVELLRERINVEYQSTHSGDTDRTDLTLMLSSGSRVDAALLAALLKQKEPAKASFSKAWARIAKTAGRSQGGWMTEPEVRVRTAYERNEDAWNSMKATIVKCRCRLCEAKESF